MSTQRATKRKQALTLSLIIPAYNEENYLKACLESVAEQTVLPTEVIVVDNGSTDKTVEIAQAFSFVKILHEKKQGVTFARDRGYNAARSDIIGRIDADSRLPADWVEKVFAFFEKHPHSAAVSGTSAFYDVPFPKTGQFLTSAIRTTLYYLGGKEERYLFGSNMAIQRSAWQAVEPEVCRDYGIHEDNDLAIHLVQAGYHVSYSNHLHVAISARRADSPLRDAFRYAFMQHHTYRRHNMFSVSAIGAVFALTFAYPIIRLLRAGYDPAKHRFHIKYLFSRRNKDVRKLPMD